MNAPTAFKVVIRDASGKEQKEITIEKTGEVYQIDIRDLLPGNYLLEIHSDRGIVVRKITKL